jgi:hypothetical protein
MTIMNLKVRALLIVISISFLCPRSDAQDAFGRTAKTFVVATDGDDAGLGGANLPFKTIGHAIETALPGDTILVGPGTYRESLVISNSGTDTKPITIAAQTFGTVVIDGADPMDGWTRDGGTKPIYSVPWDHDFFYSSNARSHFGPKTDGTSTAIGYAEQFIEIAPGSQERVLKQVIDYYDLAEGEFVIDYTAHKVSVYLTGGADPATVKVLGSTRSVLASPASAGGSYITMKGLIFRHAANFAQRWAVKTGDGWRMEDCLVERCNAGGLGVGGKGATLLRDISQDNGQLGLGGSKNVDSTVQDCISQRNNYKGFSAGNEAGGGKFSATDGLKVLNCIYRDNNGIGLWLDFKNKNYLISGGKYTGNHYDKPKYLGAGIMIEISDGPGKIENAWFAGNSGPAIQIGESMKLTVQGNTFIHNYIDMREMKRPPYQLSEVTITGNRFKDTFVSTSIGTWLPNAVTTKRIRLDNNIYDNSAGGPILYWGKIRAINTLGEARSKLGVETSGKAGTIDPAEPATKPSN